MAFTVEDGTGLTNSNSYASVAQLDDYASIRNEDLSSYTQAQKEGALVVASLDYVDGYFTFKGEKLNDDQAMSLPTDQVDIDAKIVSAVCAAAVLQLKGRLFVDPTEISQRIVAAESSSVGSLSESITYDGGAQYVDKYPTSQIDRLLLPYTEAQAGIGFSLRG